MKYVLQFGQLYFRGSKLAVILVLAAQCLVYRLSVTSTAVHSKKRRKRNISQGLGLLWFITHFICSNVSWVRLLLNTKLRSYNFTHLATSFGYRKKNINYLGAYLH